MTQHDDATPGVNEGMPSGLPGKDQPLRTGNEPMQALGDDRGEMVDESLGGGGLPPGHPAAADSTVSAGEILSGHEPTGSVGPPSG